MLKYVIILLFCFAQAAGEINLLKGPDIDGSDSDEEEDVEENEDENSEENECEHEMNQTDKLEEIEDRLGQCAGGSVPNETIMSNIPSEISSGDNLKEHEKKDLAESVKDSQTIVQEASDEEESDKLEDLSLTNHAYKPFRNDESNSHVNAHLFPVISKRNHSSDSVSSTASSVMDPAMVKQKLKGQRRKKDAVQTARRIRKSGEASLSTKAKRNTADDIRQSMSSDWF